jgi:hypothetical protein
MNVKYHFGLIATACVALLATPTPAAAYLDPSTGSMILQIAVGSVLAVLATSKLYWHRLSSLFQSKPKADEESRRSPGAN